jgi:hypothetical protein
MSGVVSRFLVVVLTTDPSLIGLSRSLSVHSHLAINNIGDIATLAQELHHFVASPGHLRPTGFCLLVLLQFSIFVPVELEVHLPRKLVRGVLRTGYRFPASSTTVALSTRTCRQTSTSACSKEDSIRSVGKSSLR